MLQVVDVLKKLIYRGELALPIEIFKIAFVSCFEHGTEEMLSKFEQCIDEFNLPNNITIELLSLNSAFAGQKLPPKRAVDSFEEQQRLAVQFESKDRLLAAY